MLPAPSPTRGWGPLQPTPASHAVRRTFPRGAVRLAGGLLSDWQELNRRATIDHCVEMLERAGNLDNLRRLAGVADAEFRGFPFADSDVYKVVEAVAW